MPSTQITNKVTHQTTTSKKPLSQKTTQNPTTPLKTTLPGKTAQTTTTKVTKPKPKPTLAVSFVQSTLAATPRPLISSTYSDVKSPSSSTAHVQTTIKNTLAPNKFAYTQPSTVYPSKLANLTANTAGTRQPSPQHTAKPSTTIKFEKPTQSAVKPLSTTKLETPAQYTAKPSSTIKLEKPTQYTASPSSTIKADKTRPGISTTYRPTPQLYSDRITDAALNTIPTNRPVQSTKFETKAPVTQTKLTAPPKTVSSTVLYTKGTSHATKLPLPIDAFYTSTKRDPSLSTVAFISSSLAPSLSITSSLSHPTKSAATSNTTKKKAAATSGSTSTATATSTSGNTKQKPGPTTEQSVMAATQRPLTTVNFISIEKRPSSRRPTISPFPATTIVPADGFEPEPDNVFDSELSLNQIIESLKDLEGTTMPYAQNVMEYVDVTTDANVVTAFEKVNTESVTIYNNGHDLTTRGYADKGTTNYFKQSMLGNQVSYIPQTTIYPSYLYEQYGRPKNQTTTVKKPPVKKTQKKPPKGTHVGMQHKEGNDNMDEMTLATDEIDFTATTIRNVFQKFSPSGISSLSTRESFDDMFSVDQTTTASGEADEFPSTTTDIALDSTKTPATDRRKPAVKPTPYIPLKELAEAADPMKYFESVIKQYQQQKQPMPDDDDGTTIVPTATDPTTTDADEKGISIETTTSYESLPEAITNAAKLYVRVHENGTQLGEFSTDGSDGTTTEFYTQSDESGAYKTENYLEITNRMASATAAVASTTVSSAPTSTRFISKPTERPSGSSTKNAGSPENGLAYSTARFEYLATSTDFARTTDAGNVELSTISPDIVDDTTAYDTNQTLYERIKLIENITKTLMNNSAGPTANVTDTSNYIEPMEELENDDEIDAISTTTDVLTDYTDATKLEDITYADLGEYETTTVAVVNAEMKSPSPHPSRTPPSKNRTSPTKPTKPTKPGAGGNKLKLPTLAPILNNLKMKVVNALKNSGSITLEPAPKQALGLEESTAHAGEDILEFTRFCNDVAFNFWVALNNDGISSARSLALSPFALTSMLAVLFLGARGRTSTEINDLLHFDDIVTFNPHALLRNVSESVNDRQDDNIHTNAFIREILSDRSKGKILSFFKEKVHQFYGGYVEEVNFSTVNDVVRRRTNLLMKRQTAGISAEYLKTNNVWVKPPLAGISANIFEMDCSRASRIERDGEMFFQVLPAIRQRRLVPIPAVVFKNGFTAGYDPELDATVVAVGLSKNVVSTIFVMPGQQGHLAPGDNLERLESVLMINAVSKNAWRRLLATLMERPGLEVQIPRFTHRSFVNATNSLRKLGLDTLFDQPTADLRGIFGAITKDMFVSDLVQINTFSTCGEDKAGESHHVEMYPAPPNKHRTVEYGKELSGEQLSSTTVSTSSVVPNYESERAFATDPLYDLKYLNLPLPLRPRQARIPEAPRLRFDKP